MTATVGEFLDRLESSEILASEAVAEIRRECDLDATSDGEAYVRRLVKEERITVYQARMLWRDRGDRLRMGNYVVEDELGRGGMGVVLKARHERMSRHVAVKVLPPAVTRDPAAIARFRREVVAAAQLMHENIVVAHDADEINGRQLLVMEYVEGRDLYSLVQEEGPLPVEQAIDCIVQAARGLEYAHAKGVVHRDVKPANLLLDDRGVVKVLDMGLARFAESSDVFTQQGLTETGYLMGTVDFMAPEQGKDTRRADARSDVYSLGITLHYLLVGKPAYGGTTLVARLLAHENDPIPLLNDERTDVPAGLQEVFERMVAKRPEERCGSMSEVIAALESCGTSGGHTALVARARETISFDAPEGFLEQLASAERDSPADATAATSPRMPTAVPEPAETLGDASNTMNSLPPRVRTATRATRNRKAAEPWVQRLVLAGGGMALVIALAVVFWPWGNADEPTPKRLAEAADELDDPEDVDDVPPPVPKPSPSLAMAPFRADEAQLLQRRWAKYLGRPVEETVTLPGGMTTTLVLIPPGEFDMGSSRDDLGPFWNRDAQWVTDRMQSEMPRHRVRITRPFRIGKYEVTRAEWQAVMGSAPGGGGPSHPVTDVTWDEVATFVERLNAASVREDLVFALPTEAQWEYACRAGSTTPWFFGDDESRLAEFAWVSTNDEKRSVRPVGQLKPNPFGLYDVHGNVWEWCRDWHANDAYTRSTPEDPTGPTTGDRRVKRGGAAGDHFLQSRSGFRGADPPGNTLDRMGFRLVAEIGTPGDAKPKDSSTDFRQVLRVGAGPRDRIEIPNSPFDFSKPCTIEFYVTPESREGELPELGSEVFERGGFALRYYERRGRAWSLKVWNPESQDQLLVYSTKGTAPGELAHVAAVWDGDSFTLFVDGVPSREPILELSEPLANVIAKVSPPGAVAAFGGFDKAHPTKSGFLGTLHGLRISSGARYTGRFTPGPLTDDDDTLVLYEFDEGRGTVLEDASGSGHDGRIVGGRWVAPGEVDPVAPVVAGSIAERLFSGDWEWTAPENLGPNVNSARREEDVSVTADGLQLVFVRSYQIYECTRRSKDDPWSPARQIPNFDVEGSTTRYRARVSPDGLTLMFRASVPEPNTWRLFQSTRRDRSSAWSKPVALDSDFDVRSAFDARVAFDPTGLKLTYTDNASAWSSTRPSLAAPWSKPVPTRRPPVRDFSVPLDETALLGTDPTTGHAVVCRRLPGGAWSAPVELGPVRGGGSIGAAPYLSGDGRTVYFQSDGAGTLGDKDLWVSHLVPKETPESNTMAERLLSDDWAWTEPVNLGPAVNSRGTDEDASVTADGLLLVFIRDYVPHWTRRTSTEAPWPEAVPIAGITLPEDARGHFAMHAEISPDGLVLLFREFNTTAMRMGRFRLYQSTRSDRTSPWTKPAALDPAFDSPAAECHASFGADGTTLVFTKGEELWSTERTENGGWSEPERLGTLRTTGFSLVPDGSAAIGDGMAVLVRQPDGSWESTSRETILGSERLVKTPHLARDGRTLYFHSSRPGTFGRYDLWTSRLEPTSRGAGIGEKPKESIAERLLSDEKKSTEPVNLGPEINGPHLDEHPSGRNRRG